MDGLLLPEVSMSYPAAGQQEVSPAALRGLLSGLAPGGLMLRCC